MPWDGNIYTIIQSGGQIEMTPSKLLSRQDLKNGLVLEFWDLSRPLTGDRWQVVVEVRVAIPVTPANLPPDLKGQQDQVIAVLGTEAVFTKQEVRNFVAEEQIPPLIDEVQKQLLASLSGYLGHPEFAPRFIRKQFTDIKERRNWSN